MSLKFLEFWDLRNIAVWVVNLRINFEDSK